METRAKPETLPARLLAIDDDAGVHKLVDRHLEGVVSEIKHATLPETGLKLAQEEYFDLILLGVDMPDMDGFEVCRRLKANQRTRFVPIIFLTSRNDPVSIARGLELGAVDFVTKPATPLELQARVRVAIRQYQTLTQFVKNSRLDPLSGLMAAEMFDENLLRSIERYERSQIPFCLLIVDLDRFRRINQKFGFNAANEVLRRVGSVIHGSLRHNDLAHRLKEDRFGVLLEDIFADKAPEAANRLLDSIRRLKVPVGSEIIPVTASAGLACVPGDDHLKLFSLTYQAMKHAKSTGRDRLVLAAELDGD